MLHGLLISPHGVSPTRPPGGELRLRRINAGAGSWARCASSWRTRQGAAPFLGVSASARGYQWRERLAGEAQLRAAAISQRHGLPELLGRVLAGRGVAVDDVPVMLNPTLKALMPDPGSVRDMDAAAARLADAIEKRQSVAIFGDYDVDGASSAALMCRFFAHHGLKARIYIPDRLFEGYGPNPAAIEGLVKEGAQLIVTVDCGTTSREPLARAGELGCDVVVIDHHQADEELPRAVAVVNPNRQDDVSGLGHLCAAGVCFLVLVATRASCAVAASTAPAPPSPI